MGISRILFSCVTVFAAFASSAEMEYATPESQGVKSSSIINYLQECNRHFNSKGLAGAMHGVVILRHGKIIALTQPAGIMPWAEAMEYGSRLKDGWYIPSHKELMALLSVHEEVNEKLQEVGEKLTMHSSHFYWSTTEFDKDCIWVVCMMTGSTGGSYKKNPFNVRAVSKF